MITRVLLAMSVLALSACVSTSEMKSPASKVRITGISQGKMRLVDGQWVIYEKSSDMEYAVNDRCTYNKQPIDCLRHGFVIEYDTGGADVQLSCIARTNVKVSAGNVVEEKRVSTNEDDFYMSLKGNEKRFVNVQYVSGNSGLSDLKIETQCRFDGQKVLDLSQRIRFP